MMFIKPNYSYDMEDFIKRITRVVEPTLNETSVGCGLLALMRFQLCSAVSFPSDKYRVYGASRDIILIIHQ